MRERAALVGASLEIETTPAQGTTILVRMTIGGTDVSGENRA
jgi:signal transduction histidine kinase